MQQAQANLTALKQAFKRSGLRRRSGQAELLARPSIRVLATPTNEEQLTIGASKIGGLPDLPPEIVWPQWNGLPQSFIAQFRMTDLHPYDTNNQLPPEGMMWFFYDAHQQSFGQSVREAGAWQVFFQNTSLDALHRLPAPVTLPASSQFQACSLAIRSELTLTQFPEIDLTDFDWSEEEQKQYEKVQKLLHGSEDRSLPQHRLLGYPDTLQDDMRLQCEVVSRGIVDLTDPNSIASLDPKRQDELSKEALEWLLLLQVDTDERIKMRWGSTGMLYYWIKSADLQQKKFEHTWVILQSD